MAELLPNFPKPFLDDLVHGRVLPIVGSGLSRNAVTPPNTLMPLWDDLGKALAEDIPGYPYSGGLDAISAYAHEYTRTKLVERLCELLMIDRVRPGEAHIAFCSLPFGLVCTTNFDFLLERQYVDGSRFCRPVIDEDQLSIATGDSDVVLLKLHGDLHHPQRLVVTEEDYDRFLDTYPLLSTYLANLLISRTPLLIGYSLDDPDFRQVWQVICDRLGRLRRPAYALAVDAKGTDIARFARRGVRVINLPGSKSQYGAILAKAFSELRSYWSENIVPVSQVTEEDSLNELALPPSAKNRLCFFAVPLPLLSLYRESVFPIAAKQGFVPISANDVISPGDNWRAKVETLINRSVVVVVDVSSQTTTLELGLAMAKQGAPKILAVVEEGTNLPKTAASIMQIVRPRLPLSDVQPFLANVAQWFAAAALDVIPALTNEPRRLMELGEDRAAVLAAVVLLEVRLRDFVPIATSSSRPSRSPTVTSLLESAQTQQLIDSPTATKVREWMRLRNSIAHSLASITHEQAKEVVEGVEQIIADLQTQ